MKGIRAFKDIIFFLLLFHHQVFPQEANGLSETADAGMGVNSSGMWAVAANPAGAANIRGFRIGARSGNHYLVSSLNHQMLVVAYGNHSGSISVACQREGFTECSIQQAGLCYARQVVPKLNMGLRLDYYSESFGPIYGRRECLAFHTGVSGEISRKVTLNSSFSHGFKRLSPVSQSVMVPASFSLGISLQAMPGVTLCGEMSLAGQQELMLKQFVSISMKQGVRCWIGLQQPPLAFESGASMRINSFSFEIYANYHPVLGFSPCLAFIYNP